MRLISIKILLTSYFLLLTSLSFATHLMGGWAGYQYLGLNSSTGNYKYQVTLKIYRYCDDQTLPCGTCTTATLNPNVDVGAYIQDWLNPNDPNKVLANSFTIPLTSQNWVALPGAGQCVSAPVVCVEEGIYTDVIELPASNGGYHLIFERCCRNGNIINLANPGAAAQTYYCFVPPTFVNNSSPTFALPPVPYICVNDTASILNTAIDPDGDVIVYSLVQPYNGYASQTNPVPVPPNPYTFPIPLVNYAAGYSASQPFGPGGYASVNAFTGLSQYLSPTTGYFVVAVELQEFRNNQLVGITRLDMQIIVVNCPPNSAPNLAPTTGQTNYIANVGDTLCFPITFNDANGDSVFFSASGTLFNNPPTNPPATITPNPAAGNGSVTSNFCWNIACTQAGNYFFIVQAPDNGCPPKVTNVVYTIQVLPYNGPSSISGPNPLCQNTSGTYSVPASSGSSFSWTVSGGSITSGQGTSSVNVTWGSGPNGTISVTSYNSHGCSAGPISLNVSIQPAPVVTAAANSTICTGNSVSLNATGGGTYSWSPSNGLSNPNISNPVANPTSTTNYTVTVTSSAGCTSTGTVSVTVNQLPVVNAGANQTICNGNSITLGGNPTGPAGSTYNWSPSTGLSCTTCANPIANPTATTTYTLNVNAPTTCTNTAVVTVFVNQPPVANAGPDATVCPGFTTTLNGSGGGTYNWSPSGSLNNSTISNPVANPTVNTTYTLVVSLNSCTDTDFVSVNVLPKPAVNAGADVSICIGNSSTLNATGSGNFSWSPSGSLSCTLCSNPVANPTSTTNYTVMITDANSCTNSDTVKVFVNPLPLANAGPKPGWMCPGFSVTLNASNGVTYNWAPASSLSNPNISNPVANPTITTQYTVNITDANGCANWDTLTVFLNPVVPTNAGPNVSICIGTSITIGGAPTAPVGATYQWNPSTGLNNSTLANPTASPTATTTYVVTASTFTCSGTATVVVVVNALPVISAGADVSICSGNTATLTASGGNLYSWSTTQTSTSISISPTSSSTYTVIGTDANGCSNVDSATVFVNALPIISAGADVSICFGNTTTLTASGGNLYSWSTTQTSTSISIAPTSSSTYTVIGTDANGCSNADSATVFVNAVAPTSSSTYTVIGTDANGCSNVDSATVFVNALPIISAGADVSICVGDSTTLTASGGNLYSWSTTQTSTSISVSPTSSSTYTVIGTDANGCSNMDSATVFVNALPVVNTSNDTAICAGDSVLLNASGGINYLWSPSSGLSNPNISNPVATPTSSATYTVTVTNANGCINSDSVQLTVNALPNINAGINQTLCPGSLVTLTASGGIIYSWSSGATATSISVAPTIQTTYTLTGTDANGCVNVDSVSVMIGITPVANFAYTLSLACDGMEAKFADSSLNAAAWSWNFGDGTISSEQNPVHSFVYNSNYIIILTAMNPPCPDTAQKIISVSDLSNYVSIQTTNVFTPNGDGMNDCFNLIPKISGADGGKFSGCAELTIYNRWGIPVYYSEYSGACWDGKTSAGVSVPEGTYFYIFDLKGIQLKGFVTLLR
ncbi:MAG: gliding motility-associated C-terminal domain-containing protein [Bacteroidetes bacterium]|nr:gliding motility-associated C-terminal domain-containing protein [Bacteroidota bacterium]